MISRATRTAVWVIYVAGWLLFGVLDMYALHMSQSLPWAVAMKAGLAVTLPAAILGCAIWNISGKLHWRRGWPKFAFFQFGLGFAYSLAWDAAVSLEMVVFVGRTAAAGIVKGFFFWQIQLGVVVYAVIASGFYVVRTLAELRAEERRADQADALRTRAELAALKGKLQPHFLFNTLHTLTALIRSDPRKAEQAVLKLGDVLRYVLQIKQEGAEDEVLLREEWNFVQQYLAIEQIRLGDRLRIHAEMSPEALECAVPIFSLQPIVENAINHAIAPRAQGGTLRFDGRVVAGRLEIEIADDGPGADSLAVEKSTGFGLRVVRQRLALRFPGASEVRVDTRPGAGCRVSLSCPAVEVDQ